MLNIAAADPEPRMKPTRDREKTPVSGRTFDAVVGNFIMLHVGQPERAAAEFVRVLAPGRQTCLTSGMFQSRRDCSACSSTQWPRREQAPRRRFVEGLRSVLDRSTLVDIFTAVDMRWL